MEAAFSPKRRYQAAVAHCVKIKKCTTQFEQLHHQNSHSSFRP